MVVSSNVLAGMTLVGWDTNHVVQVWTTPDRKRVRVARPGGAVGPLIDALALPKWIELEPGFKL